jgi:hypothetical protein
MPAEMHARKRPVSTASARARRGGKSTPTCARHFRETAVPWKVEGTKARLLPTHTLNSVTAFIAKVYQVLQLW